MLRLPVLTIIDRTSGIVVGDKIRFADTALARLIGLLGASGLQPGEGLLLAPSSAIHTIGMSFPIDVVALDRHWCVRRLWQQLPPCRVLCPSPGTRSILELPAGTISSLGLVAGHQFEIRPL